MDRIMVDFVNFLKSNHSDIDRLHHDYSYTTTQRKHKGVHKKVCSIIYILKFKNDFLIKYFKEISHGKTVFKKNLKEAEMSIFKILLQDRMIYQLILLPRANCRLI